MKQSQKNEGPKVVFYFQVHQPKRLKRIKFLDIGNSNSLFDEDLNYSIIKRVSENCYLPMNEKLLKLVNRFPGIKICFSLSGTVIEQLETLPKVLASFRALAQTGSVEFLGETYYHSLSSVTPGDEFTTQVNDHSRLIGHHFGVRPSVFRNTELICSTSIGSRVAQLGFKGILCDGVERILDGRNPYQVYRHPVREDFKILLRSNTLSDDIAFRFNHNDKPLNVQEYCNWIYNVPGNNSVVLLGMDYETFGEHHPRSTGIMSFLEAVLMKLYVEKRATLATPSMVIAESNAEEKLDIHNFISWADEAKDISAWLGNEIQRDAFKTLNSIEENVMRTNDMDLIAKWRHLQSSDHFYYMCTKGSNDGNVHSYFSHYSSPYEAFINYMNALSDLSLNFAEVMEHKKQPGLTSRILQTI